MSNSHRICVCGKEHRKGPVVITITTCGHAHPGEGKGVFSVSTSPRATSSKIDVKHEEPKPTTEHPLETTSPGLESEVAEEHDATQFVTLTESTNEQSLTEPAELDNVVNESVELHTAEGSVLEDTNDATVMMLTETAVNTLPFLNNLFAPNYATKFSPDIFKDKTEMYESCTVELLVFEKHLGNCKHHLKTDNTVSDGDTLLEVIGSVPFPTNLDFLKTAKSENQYFQLLKTLEASINSKQFTEALNNPNSEAPNLYLRNCINLSRDVEKTDQLIQSEETYFSSTTQTSKWYDGFLMCFGLKSNNEDNYDDADKKYATLMQTKESSFLVCKYLKI